MAAKPSEDEQRIRFIKNEADYVWGEGFGDNPGEAKQSALHSLLSNVGMTVNSGFSITGEENTIDGVIETKSTLKSVLNSYSQATVNNTKSIQYRDKNGSYCHFMYMNRAELEKMFSQRKDRIEDYVRTALRSEEKGKVDDALRSLNWAYVLLHSLQYPGNERMTLDGDSKLLINWIPSKITDILDGIEVSVADFNEEQNTANIYVEYKGIPVMGADFTYWNGKDQSELHSVKDGRGQISFAPGYAVEEAILTFETAYTDASRCDRELEMLIDNIKPLKFQKANKTIGIEGKKLKVDKSARTDFQAQVAAGKREGVTPLDKKLTKDYDRILATVLQSVKNSNFNPDSSNFTPEGLEMFNGLLKYGNATILGNPEVGYYPFGQRVVARSVPMKFSFKNNRRSFVEDVTFTFSPDKKIESVAFGLGSAARRDIFEQGVGAWSDSVKIVIVTFLENYKTAFALKRLDYINSIFDENAHIIVGHKLEPVKRVEGDVSGFSMMPKYEYAQKSKEDYMKQLKKCFASNEFVNINFSDNDVQKSSYGGDTFGIQIKQDYYSEHYGDQGYLFLFVDLNDADRPIIKVRTWQPERNPDLTPMLPKSSRDFGIYSNSLLQ
ncbi:MAG: hypothetical protein NC095_07875 [Muribaculum sp.]|nr:hypothetical protein [Muribaculum sp.]